MTLSKTSFNCSDLGNNTVTLTVTDLNGDSDNCTATVAVVDNIAPQISCPTLPAVSGCSATVPDLTIEPGEVITNSSSDFSGIQGNNNWEYGSYAAFNADGFVQLPNYTGFVWNNPGVGAILDFPQLDANGGHPQFEGLTWAVRRWTSPFTGTIQISGDFYDRDGNCGDGANVRIFHNGSQIYEYLNIPLGTTGYSINLNVNAGDRIDFAIDPKFDASCDDTHFTANITAQTGTNYSDNCGMVNITQSPAPGTVVGPGNTTITLTAFDAAGLSNSCTTTLTVQDTEAPTANCQNLTINIGAGGTVSVTPSQVNANSTDNCGIDPNGFSLAGTTTYDCDDVGSTFNVTLTVTDNAGLTSTCSATVTVGDAAGNCNAAPTAVCQNVTVNADAGCQGTATANDFDGGSFDLDGDSFSLTISPPGPYPLGTTNVTLTVQDVHGATDNCTATITVVDVSVPNITCPFDITVNADPGVCGAVVNYDQPSATDNCGTGNLPTSLPGFTYMGTFQGHTYFLSNSPTTPEDAHAQAIASGGHLVTINSAAENTYVSNFNPGRIWIGHTDRDQEGTWEWVTGEPVVYTNWAPGEPNNYGGSEDWAVINWSGTNPDWNDWLPYATALFAIEFDGGTIPTMLASGLGIGATFPVGTTTETWKATDDAGNMDQCSFTVTVIDNVPPTAICQQLWYALTPNGTAVVPASAADNGSNDACGIASMTLSPNSFDCSDVGPNAATLTVTDNNGLSASCSLTITIQDITLPNTICQNATVQLDANGTGTLAVSDINNGSNDACGIQGYSLSQSSWGCADYAPFPLDAWINEFHYDDSGADANEFIEVVATGDVSGWSIALYNQSGTNYGNSNLSGATVASSGDFTIYTVNISGIQNGSNDGFALVDDMNNVVQFLSYEGTTTASEGPANGMTSTDIGVSEPGSTPEGYSLQLQGTGKQYSDFIWATPMANTAGSANTGQTLNSGLPQVTLTVTDNNGNSSSCSASVIVEDNISPAITCPANISTTATSASGAVVNYTTPVGTDNCTPTTNQTGGLASSATFPIGSTTNTFVVTDQGGLTASCSFTVTITGVAPDIQCPADMTVDTDAGQCNAVVSFAATENTGIPPSTISYSPQPGSTFPVGTTTVTATATNPVGSDQCTFNVTVQDNEAPNAVCQNTTVQLDANGNGSITAADVDGGSNDACGIASLSVSPNSFGCANVGSNTVTLTVTDNNNQVSTCTANVTVVDNVAPNAVCQSATVQLDANGNGSIIAADVDGGSSDACGIASLSVMPNSFGCANVGSNTVTLTVTDNNNQVSTCTANVTVVDNVAPNAVCQSATVQLDANGNGSITAADVDGGSSDACGIASLSVSPSSFNCSDVGANTVTLTVTDNNSLVSTCTATVTVEDNVSPTAVCQDITVYLDNTGNASIVASDVDGGSMDACGLANLTVSPSTFDCSNVGMNAVTLTLTAVDNNGNPSTCQAMVMVVDNIAPNAVCQNTTVQLDANGNGSITAADVDGGSNDACGIKSLNVQPSAFGCANVGANTVTLTVTDNNNQVSTCTATVTVQDNVAPTAVCQNTTVQLDANGNGSITTADVDGGSSDACGVANLSVSQSTFDCGNVGGNTVTLTVTDNNNQVSTCTATVTVQDNVAPGAVCQNATVQLDANGNGSITAADVDGGSSDACGIANLSVSPSTFTCDEVGGNTVTLTVTDNNNQVSTCTATVSVVDKVVPNAVCQNATVQLDANGNGSVTAADVDGGSNDACGIASLSVMPSTFSCGNVGGNTVTLTVTDNNNQVSTCTATVMVQDNVAPIAICQNATVQLDDNGSGSITAADIDNGSNDACGVASLSVSPSSFDCSNLGENTVTLTVTDNNNNPATCTATVTVEDNIDPVITCPGDITMGTDQGLCGASVEFLVTATDNCDETTITCTIGGSGPSGDCAWNEVDLTIVFDNYPEETSWSILDENESVVASGGPYVNQPDGSILDLTFNLPDGQYQLVMKDAQGDGMCCDYGFGSYTLSSYGNLIASGGIFGFSDKIQFCVETPPPGGNELLTVVESGDFFPVGTHLVTCTVFDGSENSDVCTFVITVNDTEAPMIDTPCPENITLCGAQNVFWTPPTATDNCEVVSTVSNYDPGDYFGVGTYTVTYTFFDEAGLSVSCSFVITINPVPDVEISQEDVPLWCQGIQVLTANVLNPDDLTYPLTFEWSDGLPGDPVVIAPANGEYTVTVTDALNCSTVVSTVVDEDISSLFSAYTIISGEEFEMFASDVLGGGVGIEDADEGEIGLNSNIYTFFKANLANVMIDGSSYVNELIDADFDLPFPPFQGNSFNDLNNVVVPANTTMTLSGSNYGWVTVESGATLIIDNASMYFQNLTTKKDATIIFNQPSDLMIKRRMTIGETNTINPDEHTCVIYVQDKVSINQGSVVTANIYAPEGLDVNDSGATLTTYMTGIFISNDRIGSDHNVIWNWNLNCSYLPSADGGGIPLAQSEGKEAADDIREVFVKDPDIGLNVYPNPASGIVNITVADLLGQEVELYLYDAFGKQVMRKPLGKLAVGIVSIDLSADRYTSGMYHVSLKAGEDWYNVRFILSK